MNRATLNSRYMTWPSSTADAQQKPEDAGNGMNSTCLVSSKVFQKANFSDGTI